MSKEKEETMTDLDKCLLSRINTAILTARETNNKPIDINNAEHPSRKKAIEIIEDIIEPAINRDINGKEYYELEDKLTIIIEKDREHYVIDY